MHPSPIRMWIFVLQGEMHFEARNGDSQVISAGSALLLEDQVGVGHFSKVLGDKVAILAAVSLPADGPGNDSC
jgi:quercetin dioxygenase-like cupin family protein